LVLDVATRLVQLMGGRIASEDGVLTVVVPLTIDEPAVDLAPNLAGCTVLLATEQDQLGGALMAWITSWHGDPHRIDRFDGAAGASAQRGATSRTLLVVDGTTRPLAALSFVHRAASGPSPPSCVLFIAPAEQAGGVIDLALGEIDGILPAPIDPQLFANAVHALPLPPAAPIPADPDRSHVTPIATHLRFAADAPTVDAAAVTALRGLDGGDEFLVEIVDSFRDEARAILERLGDAAAAVDVAGFARGLTALRGCAANLGGVRLCELLLSLRGIAAAELREEGGPIVQRLGDEVARLEAALAGFLPEPAEARG
jgi:hypothetical protein